MIVVKLWQNCRTHNHIGGSRSSDYFTLNMEPHKRNFQEEKEKSLRRTFEERKTPSTFSIDDIETWTSYAKSHHLERRDTDEYKEKFALESHVVNPVLNDKISMWKGDIVKLCIDGIVNAANKSLLGGGGVDGAIHRAAGKSLLEECKTFQGCDTGNAVITGAYKLPSRYIIHTVGPVGEKPQKLESCYKKCLELAVSNGVRSIAFPCISTGVYGYPQDSAAVVALTTVRKFLEENHESVDRVIFCLFLPTDVTIYEALLQHFFPIE